MSGTGITLRLAVSGYSQVSKKLERSLGIAKRPLVPAQQAAVWLTGQTTRVFEEEGRPEKWAPLSLMTLFIRAHRAKNKNTDALIMNDTGRLKGSFLPVIADDGNMFGASTNVGYASLMQDGGRSELQEIHIASFTRKSNSAKARKRQSKAYARGSLVAATERVKAYTMQLSAKVPARPFFPRGMGQLNTWGYHDKIKQIFREFWLKE